MQAFSLVNLVWAGVMFGCQSVTNSWSFLSNFQWYLQSEKITSFRFYLLHIGCCPDNCSCLSTVSFRAIFKCALYRHLQLVPSPSSHSSSLMTDPLALHSSLYQEVYVSTIHLELTFNIKINCAAHRKICYQTVNIIKHITLHWRERRVSFSYLRIWSIFMVTFSSLIFWWLRHEGDRIITKWYCTLFTGSVTFPSGYFSKMKEIYMREKTGRDVTKIFKIHHNLFNSKRITT